MRLGADDLGLDAVLDTLRGHLETLTVVEGGDDQPTSSSSGVSGGDSAAKEIAREYKQLLTDWCAVLATTIESRQ